MSTPNKKMFKDNAVTMSWHFLAALAFSESSFRPDAQSGAGALGLMGFMPSTWARWAPDGSSPFDPEIAIRAADAYMGYLVDNTNSVYEALVAYMWGIGNVRGVGVTNAPQIVQNRAMEIIYAAEAIGAWEGLDDG